MDSIQHHLPSQEDISLGEDARNREDNGMEDKIGDLRDPDIRMGTL